jgi:tRNA-splicing ligase RtcB
VDAGDHVKELSPTLRSWATEIDHQTVEQALRTSRLPILAGPIALMPDAHLGIGATIGSVIPTENAIIPSAVGVDIGCGMIAVETDGREDQLPDKLGELLDRFRENIPAGLGKWHSRARAGALEWYESHRHAGLTGEQEERAIVQFGTLGSGNHFMEVAVDERRCVWLIIHSGSRGVGNQLAEKHIKLAEARQQALEDPHLAYFLQGTPEFEAYIRDMTWAQEYAMANRAAMMDQAIADFTALTGAREVRRTNCHHNYAAWELHEARWLWITRKGAIRADRGDLGIIPGSMGTKSYIVEGLGNPLAYNSCSHGAGRRMSRSQARKRIPLEEFSGAMAGRIWQDADALDLVDEAPQAYKDIEQVMRDQADLVRVLHELRGVLSYKGVDPGRRRKWKRRP